MRVRPSGRGPRSVRDESPLTVDEIVVAAAELTAAHGLAGWSLRRLADDLGCWPQAVAHHLGDRRAVEYAVIEHVLSRARMPAPDTDWRTWFRGVLWELRTILARYPGTSRWLLMSGPVMPSALRIADQGVRRLIGTGFGEREAVLTYCAVISAALAPSAYETERAAHPGTMTGLHAVFDTHRDDPQMPGVAAMARTLAVESYDPDEQFHTTVECILDGIAARLDAGHLTTPSTTP